MAQQPEAPRDHIKDLIAARMEMKHAVLDKNNPHFKSRYASLGSVQDATVCIFGEHGFSVQQRRKQKDDGSWVMQTWLLHITGWESERDEQTLTEGTDQQRGSSQTYGKRYGLSNVAVIASEEDDDGNAASEAKPKTANQARKEGFYPIAEKAIREQTTLDGLKQWWADNHDEIVALPHSWRALLEEEKDRCKLRLIDEVDEDTELKKQLKGSLV